MKFEKALDDSWINNKKKIERAQPQGHRQTHSRVENDVEIREMEAGVDPQGGIDPQSDH